MQISEITHDKEDDCNTNPLFINSESQKARIRRIIDRQKSQYSSCSSSSSTSASCCSSSNSLLNLMKAGNTTLRRLFDTEHTTLSKHFEHYVGSLVFKRVPLWGSDSDDEYVGDDPWAYVKEMRGFEEFHGYDPSKIASDGSRSTGFGDKKAEIRRRSLTRKKSFRKLPRFSIRRFRRFRLRFRFRRLRIMICDRIF